MVATKAAIVGLFATLVVASLVAAIVVMIHGNNDKDNDNKINDSHKVIQDLCSNTYYQQTCVESLSQSSNSSDPKILIQAGFQAAMIHLGKVIEQLPPLQAASGGHPETVAAYRSCKKFLEDSINDLQRTFDRAETFELENLSIVIDDIKTWLTGALTSQETCQDRFEDTEGDDADKMREILEPAQEITINALAMTNTLSGFLEPKNHRHLHSRHVGWPERDIKTHELLRISRGNVVPNVVVAQDGSGDFTTINEALRLVPLKSSKTFVIYIKEGVYREYVKISSAMKSVVLIGDGPRKTKITGNRSKASLINQDTYWTATVVVEGDNFIGRDLGIENSAGADMRQAVALLVAADKSIFYNCRIDGHQDSLCTHNHRQFYRDCTISGTVDFVFGNGRAVLQNCKLIVKKPANNQSCVITAQGRSIDNETSAIVLQSCRILPGPNFPVGARKPATFLGRPWKPRSRTVVMDTQLDGFIDPTGWAEWNATTKFLNTSWYAEVNNQGAGARLGQRVRSPGIKQVSAQQAEAFTPGKLLGDYWIAGLGIPYSSGRLRSSSSAPVY